MDGELGPVCCSDLPKVTQPESLGLLILKPRLVAITNLGKGLY